MIANIIFIISLILFIAYLIFDLNKKAKKVDSLYASINVGDHLKREVKNTYQAPWSEPRVTKAIVTKKEDNWIQVQYESGKLIDIPFDYYNRGELKRWSKVKFK